MITQGVRLLSHKEKLILETEPHMEGIFWQQFNSNNEGDQVSGVNFQ